MGCPPNRGNSTPGKFSFSLFNSDGTSRVQNLQLFLNDDLVTTPGSTVVTNCPGCLAGDLGAVDFNYTTNAGSNGATSLLQTGDARGILNGDAFAGNNNGGADGSALAIADMDAVPLNLNVGDYTAILTGTVKGVSATSSDINFSVSEIIHVITPGCSGQ